MTRWPIIPLFREGFPCATHVLSTGHAQWRGQKKTSFLSPGARCFADMCSEHFLITWTRRPDGCINHPFPLALLHCDQCQGFVKLADWPNTGHHGQKWIFSGQQVLEQSKYVRISYSRDLIVDAYIHQTVGVIRESGLGISQVSSLIPLQHTPSSHVSLFTEAGKAATGEKDPRALFERYSSHLHGVFLFLQLGFLFPTLDHLKSS